MRPRFRIAALVLGSCVVVTTAWFLARARVAPDPHAATESDGKKPSPLPSFAQRDQAESFRNAVMDGDSRALEIIDRALAVASATPAVDRAYVTKLEQMRKQRLDRLNTYRNAQPPP